MVDNPNREFRGGVFAESGEGRQAARLRLLLDGLQAETDGGESYHLPYDRMRLEHGGASGQMLFVRDDSTALTFVCEDAELLSSLGRQPSASLQQETQKLSSAHSRKQRQRLMWGAAAIGLALLLVFALPGLLRLASSIAISALPMSVDQAVGKMAIENMDLGGEVLDDAPAQAAMQAILDRLGPHAERQDVHFRVRIIGNEALNAFALPGGEMVVFSGLLARAESAEQVAGVMAHEMAHVTRRHGLKRMAQSMGLMSLVQLVFGDAAGLLALGKDLFSLALINSYSRDQESEADTEAVAIMLRAQLDARALAGFFRLIQQEHGQQANFMSWMSTHPDPQARIELIDQVLSESRSVLTQPLSLDWSQLRARMQALETHSTKPKEVSEP